MPRRTLATSLAVLGCFVANGPVTGQTAGSGLSARLAEIEARIPALMEKGAVTGLSIAVVSGGETVWSKGFGVRSRGGKPVDEDTIFEAASLGKPVFAYGVLKLVDAGRLDLDRPLAELVAFREDDDDERYERITARHVLSHTPGFPYRRPRLGGVRIVREPGTQFQYSSEGYTYLQRVVEFVTEEPLDEFMTDAVFEPLGMSRSSFVFQADLEDQMAIGHRPGGAPRIKRRIAHANAAWSLHTTARDFARFVEAAMSGEGLGDSTHADMLTPQIAVEPGLSWGLGWGLADTTQGRTLWHRGHGTGFRCYATGRPADGLGMVFFTNSDNGMRILEALVEGVMGGGDHPALRYLDYESYDSPPYVVYTTLEKTILTKGAAAGIAQYLEFKATQPPEAFEENMLNTFGYMLLREARIDEAIEIFNLNIDQYPQAWNPYDSLGEAYMIDGQLSLAIEYYERSIVINPNNVNGHRMLQRIRQEHEAGFLYH